MERVLPIDIDPRLPPTTRLCLLALAEGFIGKASAVRFDPDPHAGSVAYEVGGHWKDAMKIPTKAYDGVVKHLKSMANLDLGRRPEQQGSLQLQVGDRNVVATVSIREYPNGEQATVQFQDSTITAGSA